MNTIKKILIPVDFLQSAKAAMNYVIGMSKTDRTIAYTLVHVQNDERKEKFAKSDLEYLKEELFTANDLKCETLIEHGELTEALIRLKNELKIDLIVMGTAGTTDDNYSSNTIDLLKNADCTVLVVPENNRGFELKNIALAMDSNQVDDTSNLGVLHDLARWYNARVHALTVDKNMDEHEIKLGEQYKTLDYYLDNVEHSFSFPQNTDIEKGIEEYVKENHIDVLAMLPRHHAQQTKPSNGQLTQVLAGHTDVPLLILD